MTITKMIFLKSILFLCFLTISTFSVAQEKELTDYLLELKSLDPAERRQAAAKLGELGHVEALESLAEALDDPDEAVKINVLSSIEKIITGAPLLGEVSKRIRLQVPGIKTSIALSENISDALLRALQDQSPRVKVKAAEVLSLTGDRRVVVPLTKLLIDGAPEEAEAARSALLAIGTSGIPELIELTAGADEKNKTTIKALIIEMGPNALPSLISALSQRRSAVRIFAVDVLEEMGNLGSIPPLTRLLNDEDSEIRLKAASALVNIFALWSSTEKATAKLEEEGIILQDEETQIILRLADESLQFIFDALEDETPEVRIEAAETLGYLRDIRSVYPLAKAFLAEVTPLEAGEEKVLGSETSSLIKTISYLSGKNVEPKPPEVAFQWLVEAISTIGTPIRGQTLMALEDADPNVVFIAIQVLGNVGTPDDIGLLSRLIKIEVAEWRKEAARAVGNIALRYSSPSPWEEILIGMVFSLQDPTTDVFLKIRDDDFKSLATALEDDESSVRQEGIEALGRLRDIRAIYPLMRQVMRPDEDPLLKKNSVVAMAASGYVDYGDYVDRSFEEGIETLEVMKGLLLGMDEEAVEPLIEATYDKERPVKMLSVRLLRELGDKRAVIPLSDLLKTYRGWPEDVQKEAMATLGELGGSEGASVIIEATVMRSLRESSVDILISMGEEAILPLIEASGSSRAEIRESASVALIVMGYQRIVEPAIETLLGSADENLRTSAARWLGNYKSPRVIEALIEALGDESQNVRETSSQALLGLGKEKILRPLAASIGRANPNLRGWAAVTLGRIGEETIDLIIPLLEDENGKVRSLTLGALYMVSSTDSLDYLLSALEDDTPIVRKVALGALAELRHKDSIEALSLYLSSETDIDLRLDALDALQETVIYAGRGDEGKLSKTTVSRLIPFLKDEGSRVRSAAARILAWSGDGSVARPISDLLADGDERVRKVAVDALVIIGEEAVEVLIEIVEFKPLFPFLATDGREELKKALAAQALGRIGSGEGVEALTLLLEEENPETRREAVVALGIIADGRSVSVLGQLLEKDEIEDIKLASLKALIKIGGEEAVGLMIETIGEGSGNLALEAAYALGEMKNVEAVSELINALDTGDGELRRMAAEALGKIGDERSVEALLWALRSRDELLRRTASQALGRFGESRATDALVNSLEDESLQVRVSSFKALLQMEANGRGDLYLAALGDRVGEMRDLAAIHLVDNEPRAVEILKMGLDSDDAYLRQETVRLLGRIGGEGVPEALLDVLDDEDENVRLEAVEAIGERADESYLEGLSELLDDDDYRIRVSALRAFRRIGGATGVRAIVRSLEDSDQRVRREAATGLTVIQETEALKTFSQSISALLNNSDPYIRGQAARALGRMKADETADLLIASLSDRDPYVVSAALYALGEIGDPRSANDLAKIIIHSSFGGSHQKEAAEALVKIGEAAVGPFIDILRRGSWSAKWRAAEALGIIGDRAVPLLAEVLEDRDWSTRRWAAEALVQVGRSARPELIGKLESPHWYTRGAAARALGRIEAGEAIEKLIPLLKDPNRYVRAAGAEALGQIGNQETIKDLQEALTHEADYQVRDIIKSSLFVLR